MHALAPVDAVLHGTGWWIEREPDVRFGECVVVPELVGFRTEKHTETPDGVPILVCPDFCCEVLSPATFRAKRAKKLRLYARGNPARARSDRAHLATDSRRSLAAPFLATIPVDHPAASTLRQSARHPRDFA